VPPLAAILEAVDVSLAVSLAAAAFWVGAFTRAAAVRLAALEKWQARTVAVLETLAASNTENSAAIRAIFELLTSPGPAAATEL
jgi:hypothetical protein